MTPCEHSDELMMTTTCHRAGGLARALAKRVAQTHMGPWRYYFSPTNAAKFRALLEGGWHAVKYGRSWRYTRDPRPIGLAKALREAAK
jgi:hypothetical protein